MSTKNKSKAKDTKNTSIALAQKTLQPPPKKSEVLEALYILAFERFTAEQKERETRRTELKQQWDTEVRKNLATPRSIKTGSPNDWETHDVILEIKPTITMKQIAKQWEKNRVMTWNEAEERKNLAASLNEQSSRAKLMIEDPASRTALETMLTTMGY